MSQSRNRYQVSNSAALAGSCGKIRYQRDDVVSFLFAIAFHCPCLLQITTTYMYFLKAYRKFMNHFLLVDGG